MAQQQCRDDWIEVYHSMPSWPNAYVVYKADDAAEFTPNGEHQLADASFVREGFRVFRIRAVSRLQLAITNGSARQWDDNWGKYYYIEGPGRYVISGGITRVGDADTMMCEMSARTSDSWIEIHFEAALWADCFLCYLKDGEGWTTAPGVKMDRTPAGAFMLSVKAQKLEFAFTDGGEYWDSNAKMNYTVGMPGKYKVTDGQVVCLGPADKDLESEAV